MCFPEKIRKKVMEKAGYCCCVCHNTSASLEVHHIMPKEKGGDDSIENAAPLCPNCHSDFGDNVKKRTRIKQMRDWWYKMTAQMYENKISSPEQLCEIHDLLQYVDVKQDSILKKQDKHDTDLESLKTQLKAISNNTIDNMTTLNWDATTFGVMGTAVSSIQGFRSGDIPCPKCRLMVDVRHDFCPRCGQYIG